MPATSVGTISQAREASKHAVHVGFVPLIDAAPLIVARELGYFSDEGLDVCLDPQIGWGNVRDRLTYGQLHASHAPLGMVPASLTGQSFYDEPLGILICLGAGGNAITVSRSLAALGNGPGMAAKWRRQLDRPLSLAYVFSFASHHFFLRELLQAAGLHAQRDATLSVLPPTQMAGLLESGVLDGYCVGEPYNTLAVMRGCGEIIKATTEFVPDHPEKVLAVTRKWHRQNPIAAERLVRATIRGCDFCDNPANHGRLVEILARPEYLNLSEEVIARSLSIDSWLRPIARRPRFRTWARGTTEPRASAVEWVLRQMIRWGNLSPDTNYVAIAEQSLIPEPYQNAVSAMSRPAKRSTAILN